MGMYTEIYINCKLKKNLPYDVKNILNYIFVERVPLYVFEKTNNLPNHPFFSCERWMLIGSGSSHYFIPFTTSNFLFNKIAESYFLTFRSDLKNYDQEIEQFFDWIMPYVDEPEGQFIGYHRYEEELLPTLVVKLENDYDYEQEIN